MISFLNSYLQGIDWTYKEKSLVDIYLTQHEI